MPAKPARLAVDWALKKAYRARITKAVRARPYSDASTNFLAPQAETKHLVDKPFAPLRRYRCSRLLDSASFGEARRA